MTKGKLTNNTYVKAVVFVVAFLLIAAFLIYCEKSVLEYEYLDGKVTNVYTTNLQNGFDYIKEYHVEITLEDGDVFTVIGQHLNKYTNGKTINVRKSYKVEDGERKFVDYNILSN